MDASLQKQAEQLASKLASQSESVEDLNSLMRLMMKPAMERMLDTEMDVHLGRHLPTIHQPFLTRLIRQPVNRKLEHPIAAMAVRARRFRAS